MKTEMKNIIPTLSENAEVEMNKAFGPQPNCEDRGVTSQEAFEALSRRRFLQGAGAVSAAMLLGGCGGASNSPSANNPSPEPNPNPGPEPTPEPKPQPGKGPTIGSGKKALVYLVLGGGNDSFNMLVPTSSQAYNQYRDSRSNLAIPKADLLPLQGFVDRRGKDFGLHPAMPEIQKLFEAKKLSFLANIGALVAPTTKLQIQKNEVDLPLGLLSHADQIRHWQTARPDIRTTEGWFGRLADKMQANKPSDQVSMNISLGGTNILQSGQQAKEYSITKDGSVGLQVNEQANALDKAIFKSFNQILDKTYSDAFEKTFIDITKEAQTHHETFNGAVKNVNINTPFSEHALSQQFKMVAKAIASSSQLGMEKQTFFIHYYGWDHHDELLKSHADMLGVVSKALSEFQTALQELNLEDQVLTFTGSDFGRTLTSNGNGTDHGWGGNAIVMGTNIDGGKVFGNYPDLILDSDLDIGGGVMIPTTAMDKMFAELAMWFGVPQAELPQILPNIARFYPLDSADYPLKFIKS